MSQQRAFVFAGLDRRFEAHAEEWAEILLFLEDWGWKPEQLRTWYLAPEAQVSNSDSHNLAAAAQRVLDSALKDPIAVYLVPLNMAKLYEFVEFCKAGRISKGRVERTV